MLKFNLQNKNFLLTGYTGFLGQYITKSLLNEEGSNVFALDINTNNQVTYVKENFISAFNVDISDEQSVLNFKCHLQQHDIKLDGIINNAAVNYKGKDIPSSNFAQTISTNIVGTYNVISKLIDVCTKECSVVNISSVYAAHVPDFNIYENNEYLYSNISYGCSKAAVEQMNRYWANVHAPIRFNCIAPGGIFQNHNEEFVQKYSERTPLKRMATTEDVTNAILFLLSPLSRYITGQVLKIDGGRSIS